MDDFFHSVRLDADKCKGCLHCIKRCPTGAIRVRAGKASIMPERCIDCGECIRVCPHHAKVAETDPLEAIHRFKYKVALPAPALFGQFHNLDDVDYVLNAFTALGFDDVFEVSRGAELVSEATRVLLAELQLPRPVISSACPAVCRIIRVRFEGLLPHVLPMNAPMEVAANLARKEAVEKTGLSGAEIGVFFITPCPAKMTDVRHPIGVNTSSVSGAIAISTVYPLLVRHMDKLREKKLVPMSRTGIIGVSWAGSGGESSALLKEKYLAADGIENVMKVLEEIEDEKLSSLDFVELNACPGGCVGGPLTVENPYVAKARLQRLRKYLPVSCNHLDGEKVPREMEWEKPLTKIDVLRLADTVAEAMRKMNKIDQLEANLPGLDCGVCGAPTCRALAEDSVRGIAKISDCAFIAGNTMKSGYIPAPFRTTSVEDGDGNGAD